MKRYILSFLSGLLIIFIWSATSSFSKMYDVVNSSYSATLDNFAQIEQNTTYISFSENNSYYKKCAKLKNQTKLAQIETDDDDEDNTGFLSTKSLSNYTPFNELTNTSIYNSNSNILAKVDLPFCAHLSYQATIKYLFINVFKI